MPPATIKRMRGEDRLAWLMDLYRLFQDPENTDTFPDHILNALEGLMRSDEPDWKARKLPDDK